MTEKEDKYQKIIINGFSEENPFCEFADDIITATEESLCRFTFNLYGN